MNDSDDKALHELLLAWEEPPPEEAATQRLLHRLSERLQQTLSQQNRCIRSARPPRFG